MWLKFIFVLVLTCCSGTGSSVVADGTDPDGGKTTAGAAVRTTPRSKFQPPSCNLLPKDEFSLPKHLVKLGQDGKTHLVQYNLSFLEFDAGVLNNISFPYYKPSIWQRVFSRHGEHLLQFQFNFNALSLGILDYGVEKLDVPLVDSPPKCFPRLDSEMKLWVITDLLMRDFQHKKITSTVWPAGGDKNSVCVQKINTKTGARFVYECCVPDERSPKNIKCEELESDKGTSVVFILLVIVKVGFLLFGPLALQKFILSDSVGKTEYVVPLKTRMDKTILVRKVPFEEAGKTSQRKEMRRLVQFRKLVKDVKSEQVSKVSFNRLDIVVDKRKLMSEGSVPIGLVRFLFDTFIRCGIGRSHPFLTCCAESIMGSWTPRFLWLKLKTGTSDCNRGCREICSWSAIFNSLGGLVLMAIIPLPYYFRLLEFYLFERDELIDRRAAMDNWKLEYTTGQKLFQFLSTDCAIITGTVHVAFAVSFLFVFGVRCLKPETVDDVMAESISDMRKVRYRECARMFFAHLLLPFEKFGLFGVIVGAIYWPIVLPISIVCACIYCIPTLYLTGRLILPARPPSLDAFPIADSSRLESLSDGVTSISSCFMLNNISGSQTTQVSRSPSQKSRGLKSSSRLDCFPSVRVIAGAIGSGALRLAMITCLLSVLVMYTEALDFLVRVCFFTLIGAILNSDTTIAYVILACWTLVYILLCYHRLYSTYLHLSKAIFRFLKQEITRDAHVITFLGYAANDRVNMAFKYTPGERRHGDEPETKPPSYVSRANKCQSSVAMVTDRVSGVIATVLNSETARVEMEPDRPDCVECQDGKLCWKIHSLIVFIDSKDNLRIPRDVFHKISELDMPGNPGPIRRAIIKSAATLIGLLLFLTFLFVVVLVVKDVYDVSTTNQALLILTSGSIPLVVYLIVARTRGLTELGRLSFDGKIRNILRGYSDTWPVHDLDFEQREAGDQLEQHPASDIDMLITILDDDDNNDDEIARRASSSSLAPRVTATYTATSLLMPSSCDEDDDDDDGSIANGNGVLMQRLPSSQATENDRVRIQESGDAVDAKETGMNPDNIVTTQPEVTA